VQTVQPTIPHAAGTPEANTVYPEAGVVQVATAAPQAEQPVAQAEQAPDERPYPVAHAVQTVADVQVAQLAEQATQAKVAAL